LDTVNLLRQVSIFRELPAEVLADLAGRVRPRSAEAGSVIVNAEEPGDSLFVIARGKVKVVLYGETGREIILSLLHAGDFFGEMSLLDRQPRSANVVAVESSELLGLDREAFQTFGVQRSIQGELNKSKLSGSSRMKETIKGHCSRLS